MMGFRRLCIAGALVGGVLLVRPGAPEPRKQFGASVTGAFEGWYENGRARISRRVLQSQHPTGAGYSHRPQQPDRARGPDMGQPTHFLPSRQFGMFAIPVPKGFTPEES